MDCVRPFLWFICCTDHQIVQGVSSVRQSVIPEGDDEEPILRVSSRRFIDFPIDYKEVCQHISSGLLCPLS